MALIVKDTFTEGSNTALESHTPDVGGAWIKIGSGGATVNATNDYLVGDSTGASGIYYNTSVPVSANYYVEADIRQTGSTSAVTLPGVLARLSSGLTEHYQVYWDGTFPNWFFEVFQDTTSAQLGSYSGDSPITATRRVRLEVSHTVKRVLIDGVLRMSSTNNDVTAANYAGVRTRAQAWVDNFTASVAVPQETYRKPSPLLRM